jgi:hypothetical protein
MISSFISLWKLTDFCPYFRIFESNSLDTLFLFETTILYWLLTVFSPDYEFLSISFDLLLLFLF